MADLLAASGCDAGVADTMNDRLALLQEQALAFRNARDWEQFHNAKDLAISLSLEAAEVLELFQWQSSASVEALLQDPAFRSRISQELADVLTYLLLLSDRLGIDLGKAFAEKMAINDEKYPVDKAYGRSTKYHEL